MKPPVVDAHLRSLVFCAQWSVHKTTPKKWEKVCFPCLHAGRKTQHMAYACFSSKENQLPVSYWTSEFTSSTKTKTQWFFDCFLVRRSKHPHVFCLEIDWSKQHWPSMMSANPNIYWTQVSCNWTKHFAGNLSPGNVGLNGSVFWLRRCVTPRWKRRKQVLFEASRSYVGSNTCLKNIHFEWAAPLFGREGA